MSITVIKFGGSSVSDARALQSVASRTAHLHKSGVQVVAVVSAMADTTDELLRLASQVSSQPSKRELDKLLATGEQVSSSLLAMTLVARGCPAVSLSAYRLGIRTSSTHSRARVLSIDPSAIQRHLDSGQVVVVAGFQGISDEGEITTLGRGGSDTSAVALATALGASECDIFTDVDGVFTADPRRVPNARKLDHITYDEMLELALAGAGVMHGRAVEFGKRHQVPFRVRPSRSDGAGTLVSELAPNRTEASSDMEDSPPVTGCALKEDLGRITLQDLPESDDLPALVFGAVADADIPVDDIIQIEAPPGTASLCFTVEHADLADVKPLIEGVIEQLGAGSIAIDVGLSKVSIVGAGMQTQSGVAARMFAALGDAGIRIANITTSEIKISCIISRVDGTRALQAVHDAFELGETDQSSPGVSTSVPDVIVPPTTNQPT